MPNETCYHTSLAPCACGSYVPRHKAYGLITRGARLRGVIGSTGRAPFPGTSVWVADKYKPRHVA